MHEGFSLDGRVGGAICVEACAAGARTLVILRGEHDVSTAHRLAGVLSEAVGRHAGDVVVDLALVDFMDASTIGPLARASDQLRAQGRTLLVRDPSRRAALVLEVCAPDVLIEPPCRGR